ncbi:MAG: discoidin domain-containing protein, partial [Desulfobacterales bacterium]|nr:discoidin domain-containing protein [Desulfobacterales bacterium]
VASVSFKVGVSVTGQRPFPSAPEIPEKPGCRTLAQVYTDGSGDRRTKKLGGNYAAIRLDSLRNDQTLRVEAVSGRLMYVTLHARYQGGYWRTIYKGPKTEFPVGQYIASYKKDRNCTHVNVSVNGAHEKYDPVACRANLLVCSAPDKPGRVLPPPPPSRKEKSVSITGPNSIKVGQTLQYKAWLHYTDGTKRDVTSTSRWMVYPLTRTSTSARVSKGRLRVLKVDPKGTLVKLGVKYSSSQHRISLNFTKDVRVIYWKKMLANLSLRKPARQSSTGYGGTAQLAVDGNTDGNYSSRSTTHTNHEKNPWWEVDLGAVYKLENVLVYNRTDACSERLDNFQVLVSVKPFPNSPVTANNYTIKGWTVQKAQNINRINLGKTHGRYVRIQLLGQNYLSLAEVIVNGVSTETHPMGTETDTTVELSNAQKKLLVLEQLYKEAYERYQDSIRKMGTRHPATQQAFEKYELLVKIYEQVKQEYIQSNQGRGGSLSSGREVITAKMRKDVLSQLTQEAYQRYQDSLRIRGINHFATQRAFDQYRWLFDINRQVN